MQLEHTVNYNNTKASDMPYLELVGLLVHGELQLGLLGQEAVHQLGELVVLLHGHHVSSGDTVGEV